MDLRKVIEKLKKKGEVAEVKNEKSRSFDFAFVENRAYLIRTVGNADSLSQDNLEAFKKCASVVGAEPLVVSKKCKGKMSRGVVYQRYGVPVMSGDTFFSYLGEEELAVADRGGIRVPIKCIREAREEEDISRNLLAEKLDVSPEMVRRYEEGQATPSREVADKLKKLLGQQIIKKIHFDVEERKRAFIGKAPFEVAFKKSRGTFLVSFKDSPKRMRNLEDVADVLGAEPVVSKDRKLEDLGL